MCLFTCQKCKTTINQRETGTHVCEVRADEVATDYIAATVLPIIRKAQADAWQAGVNFALPRAETTHFARHNPHRTEENRS
ncbi:hypothetical protein ACTXJ1_10165 [Brachybacterium alimentarium]|uniref:hypothetical protein n=1 Tax=Brachybacterium alimentarium TaxID=47845 RepID=UPI003FD4AC95